MRENVTAGQSQNGGVNIFIARQPIFDSGKNVYAYELLYRSDTNNRALVTDNRMATLKVMANTLSMGLQKLTHGKRAFIHFDEELLLGEVPLVFPKDLLAVEVLDVKATGKRLVEMCKQIKKAGYLLVMDDIILKDKRVSSDLIQLADVIKVDFLSASPDYRRDVVKNADTKGVQFLAEKVETIADYEEALDLGYQYFQGFFFQQPDMISRQEVPGYKLNYMSILKKIHDPFLDFDEIEEVIKHDVSLTYKLLKFINSAVYGFRVTVRSVKHALVLLGQREVKKWLTIIVMSGIGSEKPPELMHMAVIRARFCELIASKFELEHKSWDYFMMGMFSLMEAFLDFSMADILEELPLEEHVKDALLGKDEFSGDLLQLIRSYERANWEALARLSTKLGLVAETLADLYIEAVEWTGFLRN